MVKRASFFSALPLGVFLLFATTAAPSFLIQGKEEGFITRADGKFAIHFPDKEGEEISLLSMVEEVSRRSDLNLVYLDMDLDRLQKTKVRMQGRKVIPTEELLTLVQTILKSNYYGCYEDGPASTRMTYIVDLLGQGKMNFIANARMIEDPGQLASLTREPAALFTHVFTIKHQESQRLSANLRQYFTDMTTEKIIGVGPSSLLVQTNGSTMAAMHRLIQELDQPGTGRRAAEKPLQERLKKLEARIEALENKIQ